MESDEISQVKKAREEAMNFAETIAEESRRLSKVKEAVILEKEWVDHQREEAKEMREALTEEGAAMMVLDVLEHRDNPKELNHPTPAAYNYKAANEPSDFEVRTAFDF